MNALWASVLLVAGVGGPAGSAPLAGIDRLAFYDGTWRLELERRTTPFSAAGRSGMTVATRCTRFIQHLTCTQTVDGQPSGLVIFSFDAATGRYTSLPVAPDGSGHAAAIEVSGNRIAFPWDETVGGAVVRFRIVNDVVGPDSIAYRKEYSTDGATWLPIETGTERRVAP